MSTLGRVFIVLNLILAAGFVVAAGTFLQKQDDWKQKYTAAEKASTKQVAELDAQLEEKTSALSQKELATSRLDTESSALKNENQSLVAENKQLKETLTGMGANFAKLESNTAASSDQIAAAVKNAKEAFEASLEAQKARDAAISEKDGAVATAQDAAIKISELQNNLDNMQIAMNDLKAEGKRKDIMIALAKANGGLPAGAQPPLDGTVAQADGRLVTIRITGNPMEATLQPGMRFAIYDSSLGGKGYKGDVTVTDVPAADMVFGRIAVPVNGATIRAGDSATSNLNGTF